MCQNRIWKSDMWNSKGVKLDVRHKDGTGNAICGDVGATGKPVWTVRFDDRRRVCDSFNVECVADDLEDLLSERLGRVTLWS